jgi:hypothetical protein
MYIPGMILSHLYSTHASGRRAVQGRDTDWGHNKQERCSQAQQRTERYHGHGLHAGLRGRRRERNKSPRPPPPQLLRQEPNVAHQA